MRTLGWLMTGLGCAGISGVLVMVGAAAFGVHHHSNQMLGVGLSLATVSLVLVYTGGRLRARGKPLLPIALSS